MLCIGAFTIVILASCTYSERGRKIAAAHARHCDRISPKSYETLFTVIKYETNDQMLPLVLVHFVGLQWEQYWTSVIEACKFSPGFDVTERKTIVGEEKSIDMPYRKIMHNAKLFLNPLHVKKNMGSKLWNDKAVGLSMYDHTVRASSKSEVDKII